MAEDKPVLPSAHAAAQGSAPDAPGAAARHASDEAATLAAELAEVEAHLIQALGELYAPLSDLAHASLRDSAPRVRALCVLATGVHSNAAADADAGADAGAADADADLRTRRILLAAALEMLAVALRIHNLLLTAAANSPAGPNNIPALDRSLAGSTILTGDYCFSRAAVLAAQTDSPTVVDIFAQALKHVSEARLRTYFDPAGTPYLEDIDLVRAGVRGAAHLAALSAAQANDACALAEALATGSPPPLAQTSTLSLRQRVRWQNAWRIYSAQS